MALPVKNLKTRETETSQMHILKMCKKHVNFPRDRSGSHLLFPFFISLLPLLLLEIDHRMTSAKQRRGNMDKREDNWDKNKHGGRFGVPKIKDFHSGNRVRTASRPKFRNVRRTKTVGSRFFEQSGGNRNPPGSSTVFL